MKKILLISNGHGEDIIGTVLALELRKLDYEVQAVPLVGKGKAYENAGFAVLGPRREMPSGGFAIQSPVAIWADLKAGWFSMSLAHYQAVRLAAKEAIATVVVGDIYGILVGSLFGKRPLFQMQCLVSVRVWQQAPVGNPFGVLERLLMARANQVYPRELEAEQWLKNKNLNNVRYLGNPMLDALEGVPLKIPAPYLLLLPGSRSDAYESLPKMLEATRYLKALHLTPVVAWANLSLEGLQLKEWKTEATGEAVGITHRFIHPDGMVVHLTQGAFKTALLDAKAAISTSGTAAEQAAGYGIPVVGFATLGPQYTLAFAERQRLLLGNALMLVDAEPEAIARGVSSFLTSPELMEKARVAGKSAIGEPGAADRIAQDIHLRLQATR